MKKRYIFALMLALANQLPAFAKPLQVVGPLEVSSVDPEQNGYLFTRLQIAETLVGVDSNGELVPQLAEKWQVSSDGLTWTFFVRPHVKFHDNSEISPTIVKASLERALKGTGPITQAPIKQISTSDTALIIQLSRPFTPLPAMLANYTTQILATASYDDKNNVVAVIGSGPFKVSSLSMPLKVSMHRFDGYWQRKAAIDEVNYLAVGKGETRALMAQSGEADVVISLLPLSLNAVKRSPKTTVQTVTIPRTRMLKLNVASPLFSDVRVRQALSEGIDRKAIAKAILRNEQLAATQLFPPAITQWHATALTPLSTNVDNAKHLLQEAGWRLNKNGILEKDGKTFDATITTFSTWPELPIIATAIQAQWRALGINASVSIGNSGDIVSKHKDGTLQVGLYSRNFALTPNPLGTLLTDFSPQGSGWGAMGWHNAQLNKNLETLATSETASAPDLRKESITMLQQALPVIPIAWSELSVATSKDLTNVSVDPLELSYRLSDMQWK